MLTPPPTNDIVYDPTRNLNYASVKASGGPLANTVAAIDPSTGNVAFSMVVGNQPNKLALAGDASQLYIGLDGDAAIRRVDLATRTPGLQFSLGSDSFLGAFRAEDVAVLPGAPGSVAVSLRNFGFSPILA